MHNNTCNNGENVVSSIWSSDSKKQQKRPRVPKRGPGVAELEKMLREQQSINISDNGNPQEIDGTLYDSATNKQYSGTPTSSESLSKLQSHLEHPSNQSSHYNYISRVPEEHKMIGMKRSHSSTLENSPVPPSNFDVLPSFSHYNRPHQSSINVSHGVSTFNSSNECYRDANWGRTLELGNTRYSSDIVVPGHANFPPFATPEVPSPSMHLFPGVFSERNVLPCQVTEDKIDSYQHSKSSEQDHRPFYNFLEVKDLEGVTDGTNCGGREAGRVGIDLNLKI